MKKITTWGLLAFGLVFAACSDEATTTTTAGDKGALAVAVHASEALSSGISRVDFSLAGLPAFNTSVSDASAVAVISEIPAGTYSLSVSAYSADSSDAVASAAVTVTVVENVTGGVSVALGDSDATGDLQIVSITASDANPTNAVTVVFSATLGDEATSAVAYNWSDDCQGEFSATGAAQTSWNNTVAEDCTVTLTVKRGDQTASLEYDISSSYAKGTVVTVAGTYCSIKSGDTDWYGYEGHAPLIGNGGPAVEAAFSHIYGLDIGPDGDLYMADREAGRVLRYDTANKTIHRVVGVLGGCASCGNGGSVQAATEATFDWLFDVAVDDDGTIYIVEAFDRRVRKVYPGSMTVETIINTSASWGGPSADGTLGKNASLGRPVALALDADGILYVSDQSNEFVYRYFPNGATVDTLLTSASPGTDYVGGFFGIDLDSAGNLIGGGRGTNEIVKVTPAGVATTIAGTGGDFADGASGLDATATSLDQPRGVDVVGNKIFVADTFNHKIRVKNGNTMTTIMGPGLNRVPGKSGLQEMSPVYNPVDVAVDANGNIYVSEKETCQVKMVVGPY